MLESSKNLVFTKIDQQDLENELSRGFLKAFMLNSTGYGLTH
jgi:hypothetical protein